MNMATAVGNSGRIAKNTVALYIRMAITMFISFFTTRITLQVLGAEDYGLNNLVSSVVALFSFLNGSMGTAVQRFYSIEIGKEREDRLGRTFGSALSLHMIVALVTTLLMEIFAVFFIHKLNIPQERLFAAQIVFQISILSMLLNVISVPYSALLRAREEFSKIAIAEVLQSFGRLVVVLILMRITYDHLIALGCFNLLVTVTYCLAIVFIARKYQECRNRICWDKSIIKDISKFISMLLVTVLASLFRDKGIVILVNYFFGLLINAAYAIAMQVMHIVSTFVMNFKQSVVPQIMISFGKGDLDRMHKLVNIGTKVTYILMLMITIPIIAEGKYILELWLKTPPEYTYELVCLVLININISSFTYFMYQGVHATGTITKQQICMSLLYLLNIAGIYVGFKLGATFYYALYVSMVVSFIQCVVNLYFARKTFSYDVRNFLLSILPRCISVVAIVLPILYCFKHNMDSSIYRVVITTFLSVILLASAGYFVVLDGMERAMARDFVKKIIRRK